MRHRSKKGLTLTELMIATIILTPIFAGVMLVFIQCVQLSQLAQNSSRALMATKDRMSAIEETAFNQIAGNFNGVTFTVPGLNGIGTTYVTSVDADVLEVVTVFNWRENNGKQIGEDADLDGQIDGGEDANGNGVLDSPVQVTTRIYNS